MADGMHGLPVLSARYQAVMHLASGGMGSVFLARARGELGFSRQVAVKLLHRHLASDGQIVERFLEEARVVARVEHPHVVAVLDVARDERGTPFLVLEYVHGESLHALLSAARRDGEPVPLEIVSAIVGDVLEGLHGAHEAVDERGASLGVVHRDVSPHNVLVDVNGTAYITDFGIAKVKDRVRHTRSGIVGKPGYVAPEQLRGAEVSRATDVHGAGLVLWEALTGSKLYETLEQQLIALDERTAPPAPSTLRPDIPHELDALVLSMLERDPMRRPPTALAAAEALARILPRARPARVADWVSSLASGKLERMAIAFREGAVGSPQPAARSDDMAPTKLVASAPVAVRTRTRARTWRVALGASAIPLALGAAVLLWPTEPTNGPRKAGVARDRSASAASVVEPATSSAAPATPPPTSAPGDAPSPALRRRARPSGSRTRPDCDPPYVVENGVKRYRPDCFPAR